jgi:hypothetical protein
MLLPLMIHLTQDLVGNIDSTALVIATIVLAVVTTYYAIQTRNTVKEMRT